MSVIDTTSIVNTILEKVQNWRKKRVRQGTVTAVSSDGLWVTVDGMKVATLRGAGFKVGDRAYLLEVTGDAALASYVAVGPEGKTNEAISGLVNDFDFRVGGMNDMTRTARLGVGNISPNTLRTLVVQDKDGTISMTDDTNHVPAGGTGQNYLVKNSNTDYDDGWKWGHEAFTRLNNNGYLTTTETANWVGWWATSFWMPSAKFDIQFDVSGELSRSVTTGEVWFAVQIVNHLGQQVAWQENAVGTGQGLNMQAVHTLRVSGEVVNQIGNNGNWTVTVYWKGGATAGTTGMRNVQGWVRISNYAVEP